MIEGLDPRWKEMLDRTGALLEGHFILTSGRHSAFYLQCARLCAEPKCCEAMAEALAEMIRKEREARSSGRSSPRTADLVLSPAIGGIVIGYEVARQLGVPAIFAERGQDQTMRLRRGFQLAAGQKVLIVEDVVTTGGSVLEVSRLAEEAGAEIVGFACLFDRSGGAFAPGPPVWSLGRISFPTYSTSECPICAEGELQPVKPGSRK